MILYQFDPDHAPFYPICFFHQVTGLDCPGCGGLRAMHQLLHGNFAAALRLNAIAVLLIPSSIALAVRAAWLYPRGRMGDWVRPPWIWCFLTVCVIFAIGRNL